MTLQKLAELCHVSVSTVSKAFSGSRDISKETRQLVFETARKNDCYEQFDKGVYHKKIIAVICPELEGAYYGMYVTELERRIREMGGTMALSVSRFDPKVERELFLYHSCYQKTDGIIVIGTTNSIPNEALFPAVMISGSRKTSSQEWLCVETGTQEAIFQLVSELIALGHRDIAFLGEPKTRSKEEFYCNAMEQFGLKPRITVTDARFESCGFLGMTSLLEQLPTAVIAAYDSIAIGAAHCLRAHGIGIPDGVSLAGMDNLPVTSYLEIPLTTISSRIPQVCDAVLELLFKKMEQKYFVPNKPYCIPGELILRSSVAAARNQNFPV